MVWGVFLWIVNKQNGRIELQYQTLSKITLINYYIELKLMSKKMMKEEEHKSKRNSNWLNDYMCKEGQEKDNAQNFTENSLILCQKEKFDQLFVPTYVRCHFTNMIEMDIQNLSGSFMGSMHASFYLGKYQSAPEQKQKSSQKSKQKEKEKQKDQRFQQQQKQKQTAKKFAQNLKEIINDKLKITFQNDFVLNAKEEFSSNASDTDRFVRYEFKQQSSTVEEKKIQVNRIYLHFFIHRIFKFGLKSDIFFFPLEQNDLDLVTTFNAIKHKMDDGKDLIIRFNCMDLELNNQLPQPDSPKKTNKHGKQSQQKSVPRKNSNNQLLATAVKDLYMQQHQKTIKDDLFKKQFIEQKNNSFFRRVKISFPFNKDSTSFGYYSIIEKEIQINYTRQRHLKKEESCYQSCKDTLFCRKQPVSYKDYFGLGDSEYDNQANQQSHCNAIMRLPLLKASLGTIIQLCIPIFFLSFLTLVQFLYSIPTSPDQVRGQKIGSSTLIVATYISFIYAMRSVIPPTPSWSFFQVAVCILAASSLLPIIQSIYSSNIQNADNPFQTSGLFIATFIINSVFCLAIIVMLIGIYKFKEYKTEIRALNNVKMEDLLNNLTKKNLFLWSNSSCRKAMKNYFKTKEVTFVFFE